VPGTRSRTYPKASRSQDGPGLRARQMGEALYARINPRHDLRGKSWLLDDKIPRCANERRGRCVRLGGAVERDVEILRGLGSGKPLALRALRFNQIL